MRAQAEAAGFDADTANWMAAVVTSSAQSATTDGVTPELGGRGAVEDLVTPDSAPSDSVRSIPRRHLRSLKGDAALGEIP